MREELTVTGTMNAAIAAQEGLTVAEWAALPPSIRISHLLVEAMVLLGMVQDELQTERASSLLWMDADVNRAFATAERILKRLEA